MQIKFTTNKGIFKKGAIVDIDPKQGRLYIDRGLASEVTMNGLFGSKNKMIKEFNKK